MDMLHRPDDRPRPSLAERARALYPAIVAEADATERNGRVSKALMAQIHEARLLKMMVPRSIGGEEADLASFVEAVEEVAKADASTAWCVGQGNGCAFASGFLATEIAREIFGPQDAVMSSGPSNATAKAIAVEGGYRVTGAWRYASGSRNAQWLGAHCNVFEADGSPRKIIPGRIPQMTVLFPKHQAVVKDVWNVMGLRGTGSDDYEVNDLFVPEAYSFTRDWAGDRREQGTLYRFSNFNLFGFAFGGIACGIARAMMDDFIKLAAVKSPSGSGTLRENAAVQRDFGWNEAKLQSARAYLYQTLNDIWEKVEATGECTPAERVSLRMASAFVIQTAKDVADFVYNAAGATAIFENQPFERRFRDIHVVTQQGQAHLSNFEAAGQLLLGLGAKGR
jgi:alkylation response protein AidB-like acyl-CoA dehydrogenase